MAERRRAEPAVIGALLALGSIGMALWPYTSVIAGWRWTTPILLSAVVLVAGGALLRRMLRGAPRGVALSVTVLVQLLSLTLLLTWLFGRATALFGILPTGITARLVPGLVEQMLEAVWKGQAPLSPSVPLLFVVGGAFGVVAILLDQLLSHRRTVLAAAVTAAVGATPKIITADEVDLWWFVLCALWTLLLLRHGVRHDVDAPRPAPRAVAAIVGVSAIVATSYLAPSLPLQPGGFGPSQRVTLNTTLNLGDDLREPTPVDVLTLATDARRAPYLRVATLSSFEGDEWHTDRFDTLAHAQGFGRLDRPEDAETQSTSIRMQDVAGYWLPVPYPALSVTGVDETWRTVPENRTLVSAVSSARHNDYTVSSLVVDPTREQMREDRAASAAPAGTLDLPADLPADVHALAREVTADAATDYDRLIALQSFFRSEFRYSLSAPVEQGFDGSGAEAVGRFLEVRSGYCVHFASAFALMARSLGMPSRIVVGFLPGTPTGERRGDEMLYTVKSDQLHAWPEVYFERWGWIPFEPTTSLGTPTQFATGEDGETDPTAGPTPEPTETGTAENPRDIDQEIADAEIPGAGGGSGIPPLIFVLGGALTLAILALVPAVVRLLRRRRRMRRAADGDAAAAWFEIEDTLIDLGFPITDAETPRARGRRAVQRAGVRAGEMDELVAAIERASYAPPGSPAEALDGPLRAAVAQLLQETSPRARRMALLLPRSLLRR